MYPSRLIPVTGALKTDQLKKMSIQSLMTPAMFIVSADVLPIRRKTTWIHDSCSISSDAHCLSHME